MGVFHGIAYSKTIGNRVFQHDCHVVISIETEGFNFYRRTIFKGFALDEAQSVARPEKFKPIGVGVFESATQGFGRNDFSNLYTRSMNINGIVHHIFKEEVLLDNLALDIREVRSVGIGGENASGFLAGKNPGLAFASVARAAPSEILAKLADYAHPP